MPAQSESLDTKFSLIFSEKDFCMVTFGISLQLFVTLSHILHYQSLFRCLSHAFTFSPIPFHGKFFCHYRFCSFLTWSLRTLIFLPNKIYPCIWACYVWKLILLCTFELLTDSPPCAYTTMYPCVASLYLLYQLLFSWANGLHNLVTFSHPGPLVYRHPTYTTVA